MSDAPEGADSVVDRLRDCLTSSTAHAPRAAGEPAPSEELVACTRAFAAHHRRCGTPVERMVIDLKAILFESGFERQGGLRVKTLGPHGERLTREAIVAYFEPAG